MNIHPQSSLPKPEFYVLPQKGRDPYFGFSRSYYYTLHAKGLLRLVRIRLPGQVRSKVLVPYAAVSELIRGFQEKPRTVAKAVPARSAVVAVIETEEEALAP